MIEFFQQAIPIIPRKKTEVVRYLNLCFKLGARAKRDVEQLAIFWIVFAIESLRHI